MRLLIFSVLLSVLNLGRAQVQIQQNVGNTNSNANQIQQIQQIQNIMRGNSLSSAQWEEIRRMSQNMTVGRDNTTTSASNSTTGGQNFNVGNPDRGNIRRPCRSLDHSCIRRFLSEHSICKKTFGSVPDPFYRKRVILYLPRINVTLTLYDIKLRGLNARIEDFYVNRDTDKVVLTLEYRRLKMESKNAYYRIHRRAKEPIVVKTSFNVTYQSLVLTTIIPKIYKLDLDRSVVFAYLNDPLTNYNFGRRLTRSRDPEVQANYAAFLMNNRANIGEILLTESPYYPIVYIQKQLCDFGLDVL